MLVVGSDQRAFRAVRVETDPQDCHCKCAHSYFRMAGAPGRAGAPDLRVELRFYASSQAKWVIKGPAFMGIIIVVKDPYYQVGGHPCLPLYLVVFDHATDDSGKQAG